MPHLAFLAHMPLLLHGRIPAGPQNDKVPKVCLRGGQVKCELSAVQGGRVIGQSQLEPHPGLLLACNEVLHAYNPGRLC